MSMEQDHNGFLWFSTWDGINRFNGYNFKVYKSSTENKVGLANNRIDLLKIDLYDYIWVQTYDDKVFRFDQKTETFEQVPAEGMEEGRRCASIKVLPNGVVWLILNTEGAIRVKTNPRDFTITTRMYATHARGENPARVYDVFCDPKNQEWLLTHNGLIKVVEGEEEPMKYFVRDKSSKDRSLQAFYSCCSVGDEVYFGSDKGRVWCYSLKDEIFHLKEFPIKDRVVAMNEIKGDSLFITTARKGLILYRPATGESRIYNQSNCPEFPSDAFRSVFVGSREIWFEMTEWGEVCRFNPSTGVFRKEKMRVEPRGADRSYPKFHICEDSNGNVWVHPQGGGLSWYEREQDKLLPFYNDPDSPDWRFSNKLHSMLLDKQGNLWLCTHSKGLEKITVSEGQFKVYPHGGRGYDLNANRVRALFEDSERRIWMGKRDGEIEIYTHNMEYLGYLNENGAIARTGMPFVGVAYHIMQDSHGNIWIATKGEGVALLEKSGERFKITRFKYDEDDIYSLSHNSVYGLHEDAYGRIWVATFGGGLNYIRKTPEGKYTFISHRNHLKSFPYERCYRIRHITSDKNGNIWVASSDGALSFKADFKDPESIDFHHYVHIPDDIHSLSNNNVYRIITTSKGEVYLATFGGGLNKLVAMDGKPAPTGKSSAVFKSYTCKDGLLADILLSVEEEKAGNLWISTENGVSKFISSEQRFENYTAHDFGKKIRFEEGTSLTLSSGTLLFGTNNGILYFEPENIKKSHYVPPISLETLKISNEEIPVGGGKNQYLLEHSLNNTEHLILSHKENSIGLSFAALDMVYPENIQYAYRLEGFDKEWNYVDKQRTATYTNLPKGEYLFKVKSTNSDGVWVENERTLKITVQPSFWETPLAMLLYVIAFICVLFAGTYILFTIYRLKHEVSVEQQISDIKLRFFTNISHELRTPLTLIAGPVEYVLQNKNMPDEVRKQLQVVERNTERMLRLVNQILDFRKIQKHKMKLRIEQIDIVPFIRHIMDNFESLAEGHHIDFVFESEQPSLKLWVDASKVEMIVFNLLSNAFKYTPQGKMITLFIHENEKSVAIGVRDQGIGIPESKRTALFVRFENLLDKNPFNQQSSGIGLSFVKELVDLHQATIRVDSKEGEGSCFTVEFLKGKHPYTENAEFVLLDAVEAKSEEEQIEVPEGKEKRPESKTMLIVEDNVELRSFLRSIFVSEFKVIEAAGGTEGLDKAMKIVPDIILSDIIMPEKDGIMMTQELRANMMTSHIPIVLLTAKADMDSRLKGMELGADDYIIKPFSATYLKARVENLLAQRVKLQQLYCANLMKSADKVRGEEEQPPQSTLSAYDRKFMEKLTELMEKNMDNGDLIVDDLVKELAVSRSVFFKKLKMLTGLAPIEFIKEMRVKRAAQLIENGDYTMTQIAYMVGINDPRYFSKYFKSYFGMAPTDYKEKMKAERQNQ